MSITVTEAAAEQIAKQLQRRGHGLGLRLGVKKSGCSGLSYLIDYVDSVGESDAVFEQRGVTLVIDKAHLAALEGVEVDYRREGIGEAFRFTNPNAKASCGCGESFSV
ncbi:MAG: iron-sulfur cluster assembly accessory protein [Methylococcaceae bacterium]|nr:iron-sulfur cluster assembly accessory protein [Methylococcaceae bacterium]